MYRLSRRGAHEPLEQARSSRVLVALQIDAREPDPAGAVCRVEVGCAVERALGAFGLILIEKPEAEPPERGCEGRIGIDRPPHVPNSVFGSPEPCFHRREVEPPLRLRALERGCVCVGVCAAPASPLASHTMPKRPHRTRIARVLRDAVARLADDVGDLGRERTEVGERRRHRPAGAQRPEHRESAHGQCGCDDRDEEEASPRRLVLRAIAGRRGFGPRHGPGELEGEARGEGRASQSADYQSNFAPKRNSRGGTIVDGVVNVVPELQLMFTAGFALVRL